MKEVKLYVEHVVYRKRIKDYCKFNYNFLPESSVCFISTMQCMVVEWDWKQQKKWPNTDCIIWSEKLDAYELDILNAENWVLVMVISQHVF